MTVFFQAIVSGVGSASLYLMLAVGLTLLFGVLGIVNFAQGDFMTIAAYVGVAAIAGLGVSAIGSLGVMVPALAAVGVLFYAGILKPTERHPEENRLLATFGAGFVIQGCVHAIWGADQKAARQGTGSVHLSGVTIPYDTIRNLVIAVVVLLALFAFLNRSQLGREIRATAQDEVGASILGVDTGRAKFVATVISCGLTAAGGLMLFSSSYLYPQVGFALVLNAFAIVILAGLGSLGGAIVASLLLGIITELVAAYIDPSYANLVPFVVIVLVLLVRPTGLANRAVAT